MRPQSRNDAYARCYDYLADASRHAVIALAAGAQHTAVTRHRIGYRVVVAHNAKAVGGGNHRATHAWGSTAA